MGLNPRNDGSYATREITHTRHIHVMRTVRMAVIFVTRLISAGLIFPTLT
jgi:hypothetical protein